MQSFRGELPDLDTLDQYTGIFVTGSHCSANGPEQWIQAEAQWLSNFARQQTTCKLVASCFGCQVTLLVSLTAVHSSKMLTTLGNSLQLLAAALGGKVGQNPSGNFVLTGKTRVHFQAYTALGLECSRQCNPP